MILVDTSVWSLLLRRRHAVVHPAATRLSEVISSEEEEPCLNGVIFQEVLQGISSDSQERQIKAYLADFTVLPATLAVHERAAHIFTHCRRKGVSSPTVDCLIAATAVAYDCPLMTADRDFERIAALGDLKLYEF